MQFPLKTQDVFSKSARRRTMSYDVTLTLKRRLVSTESEYTYFYIWKNIASNTFLIVFKIVESLQYIFKPTVLIVEVDSNK